MLMSIYYFFFILVSGLMASHVNLCVLYAMIYNINNGVTMYSMLCGAVNRPLAHTSCWNVVFCIGLNLTIRTGRTRLYIDSLRVKLISNDITAAKYLYCTMVKLTAI